MVRLECGNEDSCDLGTTHDFPEIGARVVLDPGTSYQILGVLDRRWSPVAGAAPVVGHVAGHVEHAHMVLVDLIGRDREITVYADIEDDILP